MSPEITRAEAERAAKRHEKRFPTCKCLNGPNAEDDGPHSDCVMARFILQSPPPMAIESQRMDFVRKVWDAALTWSELDADNPDTFAEREEVQKMFTAELAQHCPAIGGG